MPDRSIQSFRDLDAWQLGMQFTTSVYALTRQFPREERYGLSAQVRRAAAAVPSNVSEGHQYGTKGYLHYVVIALGSLAEAQTQLEVARRLGFTHEDEAKRLDALATDVRKTLQGLRRSLSARLHREGSQQRGHQSPDP